LLAWLSLANYFSIITKEREIAEGEEEEENIKTVRI